eukprot:CAMPEP_0197332992 /NCGR_PEP_ID=MMETSP0892-20130614/22731_1 /TAXON_ID=44058 ORGANISM="Aureoumbra lagunensis, Strain CCMP1510" /NCGR_SAMPLE_ID=MMETSP0892 /ASSEMBLY_ACC=CAM_ASM_000538 /LENGTH=139 /DNA_ID=CAMNT_0042832317 /DNA_START=131 /DNA_END=546 /DNA_ORIENTATION=+
MSPEGRKQWGDSSSSEEEKEENNCSRIKKKDPSWKQATIDKEDVKKKANRKKTSSPWYVPRGKFFLHDERGIKGSRKLHEQGKHLDIDEVWTHDMFEKTQKDCPPTKEKQKRSRQMNEKKLDPNAAEFSKTKLNPAAAA